MREEAGLLEHERAHPRQVLDRRLAAERFQLLPGDAIAPFRLVAEREEGLRAACSGARAGDLQHLLRGQVRALPAARGPGERAVVADVPAQLRERDEDLRRVGDDPALAQASGLGEELLERPVDHAVSIRAADRVTEWTPTSWCL